ncbi:GTP pyrophosphokinase [Priestia megaterium]|nr:GTP pyrophosphokinase [Priestia megaterium]
MTSSRVQYFENNLLRLKDEQSLRAFQLVKDEMCIEKGFSRQDNTHYYYHCVDVAQILINFGFHQSDLVSAALLHDIVEDVKTYHINDIHHLFNSHVALLVDLVTKKPDINYKDPSYLNAYLAAIEDNPLAALIKCADRMHNFNTLRHCSFEKKIRVAHETKTYFFPFFKQCRQRYPDYAPFFHFAKTFIEPHLWEIEGHYETILQYEKLISDSRN